VTDHQPGVSVADKIQRAIQKADVVVVFLTRSSENAPYVQQEVGYAIHANKPIIPLVESGTSDRALAMLQGRDYIPFDRSDSPDKITVEICASLLSHLHKIDMDNQTRERMMALLLVAVIILGIVYLSNAGMT